MRINKKWAALSVSRQPIYAIYLYPYQPSSPCRRPSITYHSVRPVEVESLQSSLRRKFDWVNIKISSWIWEWGGKMSKFIQTFTDRLACRPRPWAKSARVWLEPANIQHKMTLYTHIFDIGKINMGSVAAVVDCQCLRASISSAWSWHRVLRACVTLYTFRVSDYGSGWGQWQPSHRTAESKRHSDSVDCFLLNLIAFPCKKVLQKGRKEYVKRDRNWKSSVKPRCCQ